MTKQTKIIPLFFLVIVSFFMCQSNLPQSALPIGFVQDSIMRAQFVAQILETDYKHKEKVWVNKQMAQLNKDEKLGQLFMIGAYPQHGAKDEKRVLKAIKEHHIGGVIFFRGHEDRIAYLTNKYQSKSKKVRLMMAMDAEWGTNMRIRNAVKYPRQLMMGAIQNNALIYEFGAAVAQECKAMGIHINFAPVVDINNNPANPVIGDRSFGEDRTNVTAKAFQYISGLQDHGVMACAKHFPGHGDTDVDSHKDLPIIKHNRQRLDSIELYPFRNLAQHGVQSVMVAHLHIPAIDSTPNLPITLSKPAVTGILKDEIGFKGLIFTDALNMHGVTKYFKDGETDLRAFLAGNDVLLVTQDIPKAKKKIKTAIAQKKITWKEIDHRVRKILRAKFRMGLANYLPVKENNIARRLNTATNRLLKQDIVKEAITLAKDDYNLLPLAIANKKMASICVNTRGKVTPFQLALQRYGIKENYTGNNRIPKFRSKQLAKKDIVIVGVHDVGRSLKRDFDIPKRLQEDINQLAKKTKVIVVIFGTPYALKFFDNAQAAVVSYNDERLTQKMTARAICGAIPFRGRLPVSASKKYVYGMGKDTEVQRMPYASSPKEVNLDQKVLKKIDQVAKDMMRFKAAPGCQVLVAKDGKIAFHKAYGYHTYKRQQKVRLDDVYDLASVTKVAATTIAIMKLHEEGKIDINKRLSHYLPELKGTNKETLLIKEIMAHRARLRPWIPFYIRTLDKDKKPKYGRYYSKVKTKRHTVHIADNLYLAEAAIDTILWQRIYDQSLRSRSGYRYSDLGFYLFAKLIKKVTAKSLDEYVAETFYRPMGLGMITFNPLEHGIDRSRIIPTDNDQYFRYQVIRGYVHDMGAGMLGGVSGHAGLFSTATDLAAVYQMLVNGGEFGGKRYLKKSTIDKFTAQYHPSSRRGIGFDRKEESSTPERSINVAWQASENTFGHLGFTGIGTWADPDNNVVYLFLSNRTYPDMENMALIRKDIRTRMQEVVYEAIIAPKEK